MSIATPTATSTNAAIREWIRDNRPKVKGYPLSGSKAQLLSTVAMIQALAAPATPEVGPTEAQWLELEAFSTDLSTAFDNAPSAEAETTPVTPSFYPTVEHAAEVAPVEHATDDPLVGYVLGLAVVAWIVMEAALQGCCIIAATVTALKAWVRRTWAANRKARAIATKSRKRVSYMERITWAFS